MRRECRIQPAAFASKKGPLALPDMSLAVRLHCPQQFLVTDKIGTSRYGGHQRLKIRHGFKSRKRSVGFIASASGTHRGSATTRGGTTELHRNVDARSQAVNDHHQPVDGEAAKI